MAPPMTTREPLDVRIPSWSGPLDAREDDGKFQDRLRRAESIGRPLGSAAFLEEIADIPGRPVAPGKRGPKPIQLNGGIKCTVTVIPAMRRSSCATVSMAWLRSTDGKTAIDK